MSDTPAVRIAMWSGPRNISTAMMRSFENRPDTAVWDEPYYAAFLKATGQDHPMRSQILAAHETDPARIAAGVLGPIPGGRTVFYQKHMTHHMLPQFDLSWLASVTSAFLIRKPAQVLASYVRKWDDIDLRAIGIVEQVALFDRVADRLGKAPPVVEGADVLADPRGALTRLCAALGIGFSEAMLAWPAGRRDSDGIWAAHWYQAVEASTGFSAQRDDARPAELPAGLARIAEAAEPYYQRLATYRMG